MFVGSLGPNNPKSRIHKIPVATVAVAACCCGCFWELMLGCCWGCCGELLLGAGDLVYLYHLHQNQDSTVQSSEMSRKRNIAVDNL